MAKKKINARLKGSAGEREMCFVIESMLGLDYKVDRNLEQVRNGGTDIIVPPFGIEVKRCQNLDLVNWWIQAKTDADEFNNNIEANQGHQIIPVVAFRQNGKHWEFLISATYIGCDKGFLRLNQKTFTEWAKQEYEDYPL